MCVCVCGDQICDVREVGSCVYKSVTSMCVFICMNLYVHMWRKCIFSVCVRGRVVCGNLFNRNCHVEASWHPGAITSCVLEYFLNCSEMFRASANDFHNRAVTWPFTPCEKIPPHLNALLHRLNPTEKLLYSAFSFRSVIPSLIPECIIPQFTHKS